MSETKEEEGQHTATRARRTADAATHQKIIDLRVAGVTIHNTAKEAKCSISQVKRVWALYRASTQ